MRSKALRGLYALRRQLRAHLFGESAQQSSSNHTMARVLALAAAAAALRPTLPKRSRMATRRTMTMHDYDYDVRARRPLFVVLL